LGIDPILFHTNYRDDFAVINKKITAHPFPENLTPAPGEVVSAAFPPNGPLPTPHQRTPRMTTGTGIQHAGRYLRSPCKQRQEVLTGPAEAYYDAAARGEYESHRFF
jgi:hypothetical protein